MRVSVSIRLLVLVSIYGHFLAIGCVASAGANDTCYWNDASLSTRANPALYDPAGMTSLACGYACSQRNSSAFSAIYQGSVCFCQTNAGVRLSPALYCNLTCSDERACGSSRPAFASVSKVPCLPAVALATRASYANSVTTVTLRVCCRHSNASGLVNVTVSYDSRHPTQTYSFSSTLSPCLSRDLTYAYIAPGLAALRAKAVSGDGFWDSAGAVLDIKQPVGLLGAISQVSILVGQYAPVLTDVSLSYASFLRATVGNLTLSTSAILPSMWRVVGDTEGNATGMLDDSLWLLAALTLRENATLLEVRLRLHVKANASADLQQPVYLLVYRPQCPTSFTCTNASLYLQYQVTLAAGNVTRLDTAGTSLLFHHRLADKVQLLPGDVPAVYQPDGTGLRVSLSHLKNGTNKALRTTVMSRLAASDLKDDTNETSSTTASPLIQLVYATPVLVTFPVTYKSHSCQMNPFGCYDADQHVLNVSLTNAVSYQSVSSAVHVLMPIANVTVSLPGACTTFSLVTITVGKHAGSLPRYVINFGDLQGNVSLPNVSRSPLSVQHLYTLANAYVTTLYTFNQLTVSTVQQTVLALDCVQGLALYAQQHPAGVNLAELTFWLTVAQGTNVSYTVQFGDHSPPSYFLVDATPIAATGYLQFFVSTPSADAARKPIIKETKVSGEEACAKVCLTSTTDSACQLFAYNRKATTCRIYGGTMEMSPFTVTWKNDDSTLYTLKNSSCFYDILQSLPHSVNVSSGSNKVRLNETGWIAMNATNQAVTFSFASLLHLNVLLIKAALNSSSQVTAFTVQSSNDTFLWLPYANAQNVRLFNVSSVAVVLDPPIVARYLLITVQSFKGAFPAARFGLSGCVAQVMTYKLTHTYNCSTTSSFTIGVTASNLVSSAAYTVAYHIDIPISNLSLSCLVTPLMVYTKSGLPVRVSGVWGNYIQIVITSQDGVEHVNRTLSYQPYFDFIVTFNDTGVWQLTVTATNYVSKATYVLATPVVAMTHILAGCKPPYVDIAIPNSCSPGVTCDPNYPTLDALLVFRSAQWTISSNVTSACSRMPIFNWSVSFFDATTGLYVDYIPNITAIYLQHYSNASMPVFIGHQLVALTFKPRVFAYGLYRFQLTVTIPGTTANGTYQEMQEQSESSSVHVSIVKSSLLPCINNGAFNVGGQMTTGSTKLDATCSSDPDLWPDEDQRLRYAWACFRSCESAPSFDKNGYFVQWSASNPYTNCPSSNITLVSNSGCFLPAGIHQSGPIMPRSNRDWNEYNALNPLKLNVSYNKKYPTDNEWPYVLDTRDSSKLLINNRLVFFDTPLFFVVTVTKADSRSAQYMGVMRLGNSPAPSVNITCVTNCHAIGRPSPLAPRVIVDPLSSFKLSSTVLNFNPATSYTYEWTLCFTDTSKNETTFDFLASLLANPSQFAIDYDWTHASTGKKSPGLAFDELFPIFSQDLHGRLMALILNVTDSQYRTSGIVYFLFMVATPPTVADVMVFVTPSVGYALESQFFVMCTGGSSLTGPLSYSLGYSLSTPRISSTSDTIEYAARCVWLSTIRRICTLDFSSVLPAGDLNDNYTVYVCVGVSDALGCSNYSFHAAIKVLPSGQSFSDALQNASNPDLLHRKIYENPQLFVSFAYALLFTVAAHPNVSSTRCADNTSTCSPSPLNVELTRVALSSLASSIQHVPPPTTLAGLSQVTTLLAFLTATSHVTLSNMTTITYNTAVLLGETLKSLASAPQVNANALEHAASQIIVALNNALNAVNKSANQNRNSSRSFTVNDTDSLKNQTSLLIYAQLTVAETLLSRKVIDEKMIIIQNSFGVQAVTTSSLANKNVAILDLKVGSFQNSMKLSDFRTFPGSSTPNERVIISPNSKIVLNPESCTEFKLGSVQNLFASSLNQTPAYVEFLTTQSGSNPYSWQPTAANMKTTFTVDLMDEDHSLYNISNATGDSIFELWIDTELSPSDVTPVSRNSSPYTLRPHNNMVIHKIDVKALSNLFINVQQLVDESEFTRNSSSNSSSVADAGQNMANSSRRNVTFIVYVQKNSKPTDSDHLANCSVPNFDVNDLICSGQQSNLSDAARNNLLQEFRRQLDSNFSYLLTQVPGRCSRYSRKILNPWTCMLTSKQLTNVNDTTYYIGVRAIGRNWSMPSDASDYSYSHASWRQNGTETPIYLEVNYTLFAYFSGCYFYDATLDVFSTAGCTVGKCSSPYATQCYCTHLTSFSNMFSLPAISFDINSLNINALDQSPAVMCFLVAVICAYCVLFIWARRCDVTEEEKLCVHYLADNDSRDCYAYEVTIWTGHLPGSGTSANVSIALAADCGETGPRLVRRSDRCNSTLQTGNVDVFLLTNAVWLGKMSHIRVWHDNSGESPCWYLLRILVRDIFADKKYFFTYNSWLSLHRGNGQIDALIPVAGERELREFGNVFWSRATYHLLNGHLWLSVVTSSTRSRFTRVQRLTCCLVVCMTSVFFNLFGHIVRLNASQQAKLSAENTDVPVITFGPVKVTAMTFIISLISAACTLPVNTLIIVLFQQRGIRSSRSIANNHYSRYEIRTSKTNVESEDSLSIVAAGGDEEDEETSSCADRLSALISGLLRKLLPLPWWSSYLAYILAFLSVVAAFLCSAVLAYSNLAQPWQQNEWLSSIVLTLTQTIFVIQPLQIAITIMIFALVFKLPYEDQDERSEEIAARRPLLEIPMGSQVSRNSQKSTSVKLPPTGMLMQIARDKRLKERRLQSQFVGLCLYAMLVGLLLVTVQNLLSPSRFHQFQRTSSRLRPNFTSDSRSLLGIEECWIYVKNTVLPFVYDQEDNNLGNVDKVSQPVNWSHRYTNADTKILRGARLRQRRVVEIDCVAPDLFSAVIANCNGARSGETVDTTDYLPGWIPLPRDAESNISTPFTYSKSSNALALAFGEADSSGYTASLGTTLSSSVSIAENLSSTAWIDRRTSVVYVEFLVFDASSKLYTVGFSEMQVGPMEITYHPRFYILSLDDYDYSGGKLRFLFEIFSCIALLIFDVKTLISLCKKESKSVVDGWQTFDVIISCFTVPVIVLVGLNYVISVKALSLIRETPKQFVNLTALCVLNESAGVFYSFLVFLAIIRLTKYCCFNRRARIIFYSFAGSGSELRTAVCHSIIFTLSATTFVFLFHRSATLSFGNMTVSSWLGLNSIGYFNYSIKFLNKTETWLIMLSFLLPLVATTRFSSVILLSAFRAARSKNREEDSTMINPLKYLIEKTQRLLCPINDDYDSKFDFACISTGEYDLEDLCISLEQKVQELEKKMKAIISSTVKPVVNNQHLIGMGRSISASEASL